MPASACLGLNLALVLQLPANEECCVAYGCIWLLPLMGLKHSHTSTCLPGSHPCVDPKPYILLLQLPADGECCVAHGCICFGALPGSGCLG